MALYIASLNSGSNGNCYYIGNSNEGILIDAGISCRETEKRMLRLGLSIANLKAIFISHEHSDHINGVTVLAHKHKIPVYITQKTMLNGRLLIKEDLVRSFLPHMAVKIGDLSIKAFPKFHDAIEPHSFIVEYVGIRIGIFTDIGVVCEQLVESFKQCHAAFLEANYDDEMLDKGGYPYYLKSRIRGGKGHLSNSQALQLFLEHRPAYMSHLLLSHLSKNNNCPDLVANLFNEYAGHVKVVVASRFNETEVFRIVARDLNENTEDPMISRPQLSLF